METVALVIGWAVVLFFVTGMVFWLVSDFLAKVREKRSELHREKMIRLMKNSGYQFFCNSREGVYAICTGAAFCAAAIDLAKKVNSGEIKKWEKVIYHVKPTFTFAGGGILRPIHTGSLSDIVSIIDSLIVEVTGMGKKDVLPNDYKEVVKTIVRKDEHLYVPYSGPVSKGEEDYAIYGQAKIEDFQEVINNYFLR